MNAKDKRREQKMKTPFLSCEKLREITAQYPTPFHLYDEKGIREKARLLKKAFAWNKGFKEYFAVKATPNPFILKILQEEGCGTDCSSLTELMMSDACGFKNHDIMFSSNVTPREDMELAAKLGVIINLDDFTHIDFLDGIAGIPETICCRYNPGGEFKINNAIMDTPVRLNTALLSSSFLRALRCLKQRALKPLVFTHF